MLYALPLLGGLNFRDETGMYSPNAVQALVCAAAILAFGHGVRPPRIGVRPPKTTEMSPLTDEDIRAHGPRYR